MPRNRLSLAAYALTKGQDGQRHEKSCEHLAGGQESAVEFHITTLDPKRADEGNRKRPSGEA
jgi:hypothetical protein